MAQVFQRILSKASFGVFLWALLSLGPVHGGNITVNDTDADSEIRGGSPSPALSYYGAFSGGNTVCGAALIHGDMAITAAHCVANGIPAGLRFNSEQRTTGGTVVGVTGVVRHPGWTGSITSFDIAILLLKELVSLQPVTLNSDGSIPSSNGEPMRAMGFGLTGDYSGVSNRLLATDIPHKIDCYDQLGSNFVPSRMICGDSREKATCGGDSGSPIMVPGTTIQIGINSFSNGGCNGQTVDAYTRVSTYYSWIQSQICIHSRSRPSTCDGDPSPTPQPASGPAPAPAPQPTIGTSPSDCIYSIFGLPIAFRNTLFNFWYGVEQFAAATEPGQDAEP
ncbi:Tryptase beta-2 [Seminavis robusta]|uniref:Tryptase beta-2 n=1 Tax=Seminavis robusta TaxID=568900 RepID=A0A9N8HXP3_9STRA|nr:Tryptase beta-2 [Seminavis robusta]|eukprot:Sro1842_g301110.1 Tryptase beta-2 (336) ;mRNA; f:19320-20425